jgi:hypothetical protein
VDVDAGTLTAAEVPALLALVLECTALPAGRTKITLHATVADAPVRARVERDKGGRLEVQIRGLAFASRAELFEVAERVLVRGAYDVRVEGPVAGRNVEARIRDRVPETIAVPAAALPPPSPGAAAAGPPVDLYGRWRGTTIAGSVLTLRPAPGGVAWDYSAPTSSGVTITRNPVRAEGNGAVSAEGISLTGHITAGEEGTGGRSTAGMRLVLRREGAVLRGTATGSRNVPVSVEFIKEGTR